MVIYISVWKNHGLLLICLQGQRYFLCEYRRTLIYWSVYRLKISPLRKIITLYWSVYMAKDISFIKNYEFLLICWSLCFVKNHTVFYWSAWTARDISFIKNLDLLLICLQTQRYLLYEESWPWEHILWHHTLHRSQHEEESHEQVCRHSGSRIYRSAVLCNYLSLSKTLHTFPYSYLLNYV